MTAIEVPQTREASHPPTELSLEAHVGDRLFVPGPGPAGPVRDGLVLQVRHRDGSPPYRVRWSDTEYVSLVFPEPGAYVQHHECDPEAS